MRAWDGAPCAAAGLRSGDTGFGVVRFSCVPIIRKPARPRPHTRSTQDPHRPHPDTLQHCASSCTFQDAAVVKFKAVTKRAVATRLERAAAAISHARLRLTQRNEGVRMGHEWSKVQRYHDSVDLAKEARNLRRKVDAAKAAVNEVARELVTDEELYGLNAFEDKDEARHKRPDLGSKVWYGIDTTRTSYLDEPTNQPTNQSVNQSIHPSIHPSINQPTTQPIIQSIYAR